MLKGYFLVVLSCLLLFTMADGGDSNISPHPEAPLDVTHSIFVDGASLKGSKKVPEKTEAELRILLANFRKLKTQWEKLTVVDADTAVDLESPDSIKSYMQDMTVLMDKVPDSMPTWAHAGQMMGPRCPAGPRPGPCWVFPGVPTYCHVGICWASPAGAQLGMPSICPQWAVRGHAQLGPCWACPAYAHNGQ